MIFRKSNQAYVKDVREAFHRIAMEIRLLQDSRSNTYASNISAFLSLNLEVFHKDLSRFEKKLSSTGKLPSFDRNLINSTNFIVDEVGAIAKTQKELGPQGQGFGKQIQPLQAKALALDGSVQKLYNLKTPFQKQLEKLVKKSGLTHYRLGSDAFGDPSHLYKLLKGEKRNPTRRVVEALCKALMDNSAEIKKKDVNKLMKVAGYPPLKD